jgi:hypothetical protein
MHGAHTALLDLEELSDEELKKIRDVYEELARTARIRLREGKSDTGRPTVRLEGGSGHEKPVE